jgi:hypothetical protein
VIQGRHSEWVLRAGQELSQQLSCNTYRCIPIVPDMSILNTNRYTDFNDIGTTTIVYFYYHYSLLLLLLILRTFTKHTHTHTY